MWVCFNDAFVSAVADPADPAMLKVRARKREHLETLFPGETVEPSPPIADYAFRVRVSKESFAKLLVERAMGIDYGNFKNSVVDDDLHDLYANFWTLHWQYQERIVREQRNKRRKRRGRRRRNAESSWRLLGGHYHPGDDA